MFRQCWVFLRNCIQSRLNRLIDGRAYLVIRPDRLWFAPESGIDKITFDPVEFFKNRLSTFLAYRVSKFKLQFLPPFLTLVYRFLVYYSDRVASPYASRNFIPVPRMLPFTQSVLLPGVLNGRVG